MEGRGLGQGRGVEGRVGARTGGVCRAGPRAHAAEGTRVSSCLHPQRFLQRSRETATSRLISTRGNGRAWFFSRSGVATETAVRTPWALPGVASAKTAFPIQAPRVRSWVEAEFRQEGARVTQELPPTPHTLPHPAVAGGRDPSGSSSAPLTSSPHPPHVPLSP